MDIGRLGAALQRRWYLVLLGLVIAAGAGLVAYGSASATYESTAKIALVPPNLSTLTQPGNPLLELDNNLAQTASVVTDILSSDDVRDGVERSAGGTYTVSNVQLRSEVFTNAITISASAGSADSAQATAQAAINVATSQLEGLQRRSGVLLEQELIRPEVTVRPAAGEPSFTGGIRSGVGAGAAALALVMLLIAGLDSVLLRRRAGRSTAQARDEEVEVLRPSPQPRRPREDSEHDEAYDDSHGDSAHTAVRAGAESNHARQPGSAWRS